MASKEAKAGGLSPADPFTGDETFHLVQRGNSRFGTLAALAALVASAAGAIVGMLDSPALFTAAHNLTVPVGVDTVRTVGHSVAGKGAAIYVADATVDPTYVAANPFSSFVSANGRGFNLSREQEITPQMFGAMGDAVLLLGAYVGTDDWATTQSALNFLGQQGGGKLSVPHANYLVDAGYLNMSHGLHVKGLSNLASIFVSNKAGAAGANAFETLRNGSTFASIDPVNVSTGAGIVLEDIGIINTNAGSHGAGFFQRGGTFITMARVRVQGHRFGGAYSQTELMTRIDCRFEQQVNNGGGEWVINGNDLGDGANAGATNNAISIRCQYNQLPGIPGLIHDGGYNYTSLNDNFEGGLNALRLAGITGFLITSPAVESTDQDCIVFNNLAYYSGAGVGPCEGEIRGGVLSARGASEAVPGGYGAVLFWSAANIEIGGAITLSTPTGASLRGCGNVFQLHTGSISLSYAADPLMDGWPTHGLRPTVYEAVEPASGFHRQGEVVFPQAPVAGVLFWRCTATGTPGTWEAVGAPIIPSGGQLLFDDVGGVDFQSYVEHAIGSPFRYHSVVSKGGAGGWAGGYRIQLNYNAGALFDALRVEATSSTTANGFFAGPFQANSFKVGSNQVVGARLAALPADATDLASVITLANAIKARVKTTGGHGLVDD